MHVSSVPVEQVLAEAPEGLCVVDTQGSLTFANPAFAELVAYDVAELAGRPLIDLTDGDLDADAVASLLPDALRAPRRRDVPFRRKSGQRVWALVSSRPIMRDDRFDGAVLSIANVTVRRAAEQALRVTHDMFETAFRNAPDVMWISQLGSDQILAVNRCFEESFGLERSACLGRTVVELGVWSDGAERRRLLNEIAAVEPPTSAEIALKAPAAGSAPRPFRVSLVAIRSGDDRLAVTVGSDLTAARELEEALRTSQAEYQDLYDNAPAIYLSADVVRGTIRNCNQTAAEALGYTKDELIGMALLDVYHPDSHRDVALRVGEFRETGVIRDAELILRRRDGSRIHTVVNVSAIRDASGAIVASRAILRDVTAYRRAQDRIRESEARYRRIVETSLEGIWLTDADARITYVNRFAAQMLGFDEDEMIGRSAFDLVHPASRLTCERHLEACRRGVGGQQEVRLIAKDEREVWAIVSSSPISDGDGGFRGVLCMVTDISDRHVAEVALRKSRREVRFFARRIDEAREQEGKRIALEIHDQLGQALTGLKMDLSWLRDRVGAGSSDVSARTHEMVALVDETIGFVRRVAAELRPGVLDDLGLAAAVEWQAREFERRAGVHCHLDLDEQASQLSGPRATAMFRILQEALTNVARHADAATVRIELAVDNGRVRLTVSDDGRGATEEQLRGGTSVGLVGMRERALAYGGKVRVQSAVGEGTTVRVVIPIYPTGAEL